MFIHQFLKKGSSHENFCEDYTFVQKFGDDFIVAGVFDGCSGGNESYFASALFGKILKKKSMKISFSDYCDTESILKNLLYNTFIEIKIISKIIDFSTDELLSTIILIVADLKKACGNIICIGDGLISINGENHLIDQNNTPDYIAYHLDKIENSDNFENWYKTQIHKYKFDKIDNITISTDGINSFINETIKDEPKTSNEIINYLTVDNNLINNKSMFGRKINILKNQFGMVNYDDLGIIRLTVK